jgi:hypothetical protein
MPWGPLVDTSFYHQRFIFWIMSRAFSSSASPKKRRASRAKVRRREVKGASLRRWLRRARGKGMSGPELVFELHVRRGLKLPKVARVLGVGVAVVREFWRQWFAPHAAPAPRPKSREELLAGAPQSEADFTALRERVCLELWETVVATFAVPEVEGMNEGGDESGAKKVKPAMMSVRMRALKQMGKLYGVGRKKRGGRGTEVVSPACATPEEIVEMVREWRRRNDE